MRTIKFRGKRIDNGDWQTGYLLRRMFSDHDEWYIEDATRPYYHVIDPATIGQFTGLSDKNGLGIWEGDILAQTTHPAIYHDNGRDYDIHRGVTCHYKVIFREVEACFTLERIYVSEEGVLVGAGPRHRRTEIKVGDLYPLSSENGYEPKSKLKIIGTIHDNK